MSTKIQLKRIKQIHEDVFSNPDCPIHKDGKKLSDILKSTLIINFIPIIGIGLMIPAGIKFSQKIQELQWSFEPLYTEMNLKRQQAFMGGHGRIGGFGLGRGFGGCGGRGFGGTGLL